MATNYWANSFFSPLASTEASLLSLGATRQRAVGADDVEVIIRLWGCISGPRRGLVMEVGLIIGMCAEVLFRLSVDAYYLYLRDAKSNIKYK